jgi:hypothetical protein
LAADLDLEVDPDWEAVPAQASCPAAAVAHHRPGSAAAADSGAQAAELPAAGVVEEAGADVAADLGAPRAAWAAAVADAVGAAAAADASSNRGAHTKGGPHSSVPNSRRD